VSLWFRPEELRFFDLVNSEVPKLISPNARYYLKVLQPTTTDGRFERQVLYGEQTKNWKFVGPILVPIMLETPTDNKEFEENRGGAKNMVSTGYLSRKNFEDAIPEEMANLIIAARGAIIPNGGDIVQMWTTHNNDVAFWDVEDLERDAYLGDLPLHLQWKLTLNRKSSYTPERAFGQELQTKEPIVILDPEQMEQIERTGVIAPKTPDDGKLPDAKPRLYK
jgi:hypothetical protein